MDGYFKLEENGQRTAYVLGNALEYDICDYGMVTYFDIFSQLMLVLVYVSFSNLQHIKMQRIRQ